MKYVTRCSYCARLDAAGGFGSTGRTQEEVTSSQRSAVRWVHRLAHLDGDQLHFTDHRTTFYALSLMSLYRLRYCDTIHVHWQFDRFLLASDRSLKRLCQLLPGDAMHKRGLCRHAVSVYLCVCVCLSRSWILSKRVIISSDVFHHIVFP